VNENFWLLPQHNLWFNVLENSLIYNRTRMYSHGQSAIGCAVIPFSSNVTLLNEILYEITRFPLILLQLLTTFPRHIEVYTLAMVE
jgi:hypothetical protein